MYEWGTISQDMAEHGDAFKGEAERIEKLIPDKDSVVVDLGCGTNRFVGKLKSAGYERSVGVDADEDLARNNRLVNESAITGDVLKLPFRDHSVALVLSHNLLDHFADNRLARKLVLEIDRVLDEEKGVAFFLHEAASEALGYEEVAKGLVTQGFVMIGRGVFTRPTHPIAVEFVSKTT